MPSPRSHAKQVRTQRATHIRQQPPPRSPWRVGEYVIARTSRLGAAIVFAMKCGQVWQRHSATVPPPGARPPRAKPKRAWRVRRRHLANPRMGVRVEVLEPGDGVNFPQSGCDVEIDYVAMFEDGAIWDSTVSRRPWRFTFEYVAARGAVLLPPLCSLTAVPAQLWCGHCRLGRRNCRHEPRRASPRYHDRRFRLRRVWHSRSGAAQRHAYLRRDSCTMLLA